MGRKGAGGEEGELPRHSEVLNTPLNIPRGFFPIDIVGDSPGGDLTGRNLSRYPADYRRRPGALAV